MKKPKTTKSKFFFTQETEDAIVKYNQSTDPRKRARIFEEHIHYPFYKLAENIIHTFKFYYTDVSDIEDLKHTIVTVLLEEKISKFDPSVGAKAYSYFGTIVKRWLINYNNANYKTLKRIVDIDSIDLNPINEDQYVEENSISLSSFFDEYTTQMYTELDQLYHRSKDKQIADAVLILFKTRKDIQVFKKKALYLYIKEMVDCKTSDLTHVLKVLKKRFYEMYQELDDKGLINNL